MFGRNKNTTAVAPAPTLEALLTALTEAEARHRALVEEYRTARDTTALLARYREIVNQADKATDRASLARRSDALALQGQMANAERPDHARERAIAAAATEAKQARWHYHQAAMAELQASTAATRIELRAALEGVLDLLDRLDLERAGLGRSLGVELQLPDEVSARSSVNAAAQTLGLEARMSPTVRVQDEEVRLGAAARKDREHERAELIERAVAAAQGMTLEQQNELLRRRGGVGAQRLREAVGSVAELKQLEQAVKERAKARFDEAMKFLTEYEAL